MRTDARRRADGRWTAAPSNASAARSSDSSSARSPASARAGAGSAPGASPDRTAAASRRGPCAALTAYVRGTVIVALIDAIFIGLGI
ncbi:hypothetical protein, partial [Streptomyces sp. NPDC001661]